MDFDMLGKRTNVETIAVGTHIRELPRLEKQYGNARWRKMKREAVIILAQNRLSRLGDPPVDRLS